MEGKWYQLNDEWLVRMPFRPGNPWKSGQKAIVTSKAGKSQDVYLGKLITTVDGDMVFRTRNKTPIKFHGALANQRFKKRVETINSQLDDGRIVQAHATHGLDGDKFRLYIESEGEIETISGDLSNFFN